MFILQGVGSNRAIYINFLLTLSVTLLKITAERNCYGKKLNKNRQLNNHTKLFRTEGAVKSHPFSKMSQDRKHQWQSPSFSKISGSCAKLTPPMVFSWKPSESFQNTQASQILGIKFLVQKTKFCRCLAFTFMKCIFPKTIFLQSIPRLCV